MPQIKLVLPKSDRQDKCLVVSIEERPSLQALLGGQHQSSSAVIQQSRRRFALSPESGSMNDDGDDEAHPLHQLLLHAQQTHFDQLVFEEIKLELKRSSWAEHEIQETQARLCLSGDHTLVISLETTLDNEPDSVPSAWCDAAVLMFRRGFLKKRRYYHHQLQRYMFPVDFKRLEEDDNMITKMSAADVLRPVYAQLKTWMHAGIVLNALRVSDVVKNAALQWSPVWITSDDGRYDALKIHVETMTAEGDVIVSADGLKIIYADAKEITSELCTSTNVDLMLERILTKK